MTSQLSSYWKLGNVDSHLIGMDDDKLIVTNNVKTKRLTMVQYLFRYLQYVYSSK
jgi:hypothetical protein